MRLLPVTCLAAFLLVFSACGDDDDNGSVEAPTAAETATQTTAPTPAANSPR